MSSLWLGLDLSTQKLKATVVDSSLNLILDLAVDFEADLPSFKYRFLSLFFFPCNSHVLCVH